MGGFFHFAVMLQAVSISKTVLTGRYN